MLTRILILGAGELGTAIITALRAHPACTRETVSITALVRPCSAAKYASLGVDIVTADLYENSLTQLTELFSSYGSVIHAGNMAAPVGTQLKVTQATLAAKVPFYIPWQFGVDYDAISREGGQGIFRESLDVRDLLRSQSTTKWLIISCGVFMSFLFEDFWGVFGKSSEGNIKTVRALGSWEDSVTATTAQDIGRCTAQLVLGEEEPRNRAIYIAGDTLRYSEIAEVVEKVTGNQVERVLWTTEYLTKLANEDPDNKLKRYHVVFSEGKGLSWSKEETWNAQRGIKLTSIEDTLRKTQ